MLWHISDPISGVLLYLGQRVERARPISNTYLTEEQRRYVGDSSVFITCTWRIDASPDLLPAPDGELNDWWDAQLSVIVGKTLVCDSTTPDRRQLQLQFDNEAWLVADLSTSCRYQDYTIQVGDTNWTVEADGSLEHELNESEAAVATDAHSTQPPHQVPNSHPQATSAVENPLDSVRRFEP